MGNQITREYDIGKQTCSAGLWKVYSATKKTTGQRVSVFLFEKKFFESPGFNRTRSASRAEQEKICELLKKEANYLTRMRHPSILQVVEPVDETRTAIAFATEPILASLSNLLRNYQGLSSVPIEIEKYELDMLEIQRGIHQVAKGLEFCHTGAKIVHHNLCPDSVFVNSKGDWKISGFRFSTFLNYGGQESSVEYPEFDSQRLAYLLPELDYAAPEYVLDRNVSPANDVFALGCLLYTIHNNTRLTKGANLTLLNTHNNLLTFKQMVGRLPFGNTLSSPYAGLPDDLLSLLDRMITRTAYGRISFEELMDHNYFNNVLFSTMRYLENLSERRREERVAFMDGLKRVLDMFPERVLIKMVLPLLLSEMKDSTLLAHTLPNVLHIAGKMTSRHFVDDVLPLLRPIFAIREPVNVMITLLDRVDIFVRLCSPQVFRNDLMPLIYNALEAPHSVVQEKALKVIPTLCTVKKETNLTAGGRPLSPASSSGPPTPGDAATPKVDYNSVKNGILPRLQNLYQTTTVLSVKVAVLVCFHRLMKAMDKYLILEKILPLLKAEKIREPAILMAMLAVYEEMSKYVEKEIIATEILPMLWCISIDPVLNVTQFKRFMRVIRELGCKVENAHIAHFEEINKIEETVNSRPPHLPSGTAGNGLNNELNDFEKLVRAQTKFGGSMENFRMETAAPSLLPQPKAPQTFGFEPKTVASAASSSTDAGYTSKNRYGVPASVPFSEPARQGGLPRPAAAPPHQEASSKFTVPYRNNTQSFGSDALVGGLRATVPANTSFSQPYADAGAPATCGMYLKPVVAPMLPPCPPGGQGLSILQPTPVTTASVGQKTNTVSNFGWSNLEKEFDPFAS